MSEALYGLYADPESTQRAVDALRGVGVEERAITIISSEPYEEFEFGRRDHHTPMPWLAALGGLVGGAAGYALSVLTQRAYPLPTGGMPISTMWANGIVTYELTMLGAILMTLVVLLVSARLPDWRAQLYDPAVSQGRILVGVVNPLESSRIAIKEALGNCGALEVKELVLGLKMNSKTQGASG